MIELISGILAGVGIIFLSRFLSRYFSLKLIASTILVAIAFIYVGFSLKGNPPGLIILEIAAALIFYFLAILGFTRNSYLIAYGIMLHGLWDLFHHNAMVFETEIPGYWPVFCSVVDIIDGLYFLVIFRKQEKARFKKT